MAGKGSILFVGNHFQSINGDLKVWQEIPHRLSERGWRVLQTSKHRSRVLRLGDILWTVLWNCSSYTVAEVDVFSGPSFFWAELSVRLLKWLNKPIILILRGGDLPAYARRHPSRVRKVFAAAEAVVAPSAYLANKLKPFRDDIHVIPNPVDTHAYPFRQRSKLQPNLVWLRAFHEIYNPSLAPKVLTALVKDWPGIRLTMVGPDKGDGSLHRMQQLASQLGVRDRIIIPGGVPRQEVPAWLDQGDIFINSTNIDNTPVSVIEAMACGLPVVSTNVGGIPYLVEDGVDGLLVPPDDADAMAAAVQKILNNPGLAETLSSNARQKAEGFDWSAVLPKWEALFSEMMKKHHG